MTDLQKALAAAKYPVALTGAGISAPSGIPTFDMEWKGRPVRDFLTREYFAEEPLGFFELFREIVKWRGKAPNSAHKALAHLGVSIITQNVDGLHQKAGSKKVIEVHGNCEKLRCPRCTYVEDSSRMANSSELESVAHCAQCGHLYDIDVVLYGDSLKGWWEAVEEIARADLFLVIGTSLTTYPANQLPLMAERNGCPIVYINEDCVSAFNFLEDID
jgi:NAD-dependent deacetylase